MTPGAPHRAHGVLGPADGGGAWRGQVPDAGMTRQCVPSRVPASHCRRPVHPSGQLLVGW